MKKILVLGCLLFATSLWAQVQLTARTDKTDLAQDDMLTLTVEVSGVNGTIVMPKLPSLPAFNVYARETLQSSINGHTSFVFTYRLTPRFAGNATIGPVTFQYGGKTYQTKPISVRVYRAGTATVTAPRTGQPAQTRGHTLQDLDALPPLEKELSTRAYAHKQEPFFMVATVTQKKPFVNQPLTLAVRFYFSQAFYDAAYYPPTVTNLFMEELGSSKGQQTVQNTVYQYEERRYRLAGVSAGEALISGAEIRYRPGSMGGSLWDHFFGGAAVEPIQTVKAAPIKLHIIPLPTAGKPDSFLGAVGGGYSFSAQLEREQTQAGEAVTLTATVKGPGNLKTTGDLQFPPIEGITAYPATPSAGSLPNASGSYKTFTTELVPLASGTYTIPALHWSYFDPKTSTYKTLSTPPLVLTATPATKADKSIHFGPHTPADTLQTNGPDIQYVHSTYAPGASWLARVAGWKWLHGLFLAFLAVCVFIASIGKKSAAKKQAYLSARAQLKKATTYENVSDALSAYLLAKWHISTASLPLRDIRTALQAHRVPPQVGEQFTTLWKELEVARFAPTPGATGTLPQFTARTLDLLKVLEKIK